MPFNNLFLSCVKSGTRFSESKCAIWLKLKDGETAIFFVVDDQSMPDCLLRKAANIQGKLCDLVIFFANENKRLICLVEVKGKSDWKTAVEQIKNTRQALRRFCEDTLQNTPCWPHLKQIEWRGYIYLRSGAHERVRDIAKTPEWKALIRTFGKRSQVRIITSPDLGLPLRD